MLRQNSNIETPDNAIVNKEKMNKKTFWPHASLFFCAALYLIWPLAHTIALRKVLLLLAGIAGVVLLVKSEKRTEIIKQPWLIFLGLLLAWVVFHAGFISQNGTEAWRELLGQWIPPFMAVLAGIGLALASRSIDPTVFKIYLLGVLAAQPVSFLLFSIYESMQLGHMVSFYVGQFGTDLKTSLTFSSDMLAALACFRFLDSFGSEGQSRKKYLWLLPIVLAIFVAIFSSALNSILLIVGCMILVSALLMYRRKIKFSRSHIMAVIFIVFVSIYAASFVPSVGQHWKRMISNAFVATNIDQYTNWINPEKLGMPINEIGERVPESFYLRVAYAKAGFRAVLEHPWGYGVTRHSFERLMQQKYPDASIANAHNGYLNLSCAVGIPGLLLFALAIISIFRQLNKSNSEMAHPAAWMIGIYALHWALDAVERDHFFEIYLFVIALLLTMTMNKTPQKIEA